ncbi:MAG: hypothetical protein IJY78_01585 [Bacteroidaceae bacterium]|nr:hypothetical protein [Bacteroidaceae bacterium]
MHQHAFPFFVSFSVTVNLLQRCSFTLNEEKKGIPNPVREPVLAGDTLTVKTPQAASSRSLHGIALQVRTVLIPL